MGFGGDGRGRARGIVDFGVIAPVDVFGDGCAFGFGFQILENRELLRGVVGAGGLAIDVVELEVRGG